VYIISVIPISNIPRQDVLTYFYKEYIVLGSLVTAPYGRNKIQCIVVSSVSVRTLKGDIKKEIYQLKKIESVIHEAVVSPGLIETLFTYAEDFFVPLSKIFYDIYPKWYWDEIYQTHTEGVSIPQKNIFIEDSLEKRLHSYENEIQKSNTIWICVPTVAWVKTYGALLKEKHPSVYLFHSKVTESKQKKQLTEIFSRDEKKIVISTPFYMGIFLPWAESCIIDQAGSDAYKMSPPFYYDIRMLIARLEIPNQLRIYGDELIPLTMTQEHTRTMSAPVYTLYTKEKTRHSEVFIHPIMEQDFEDAVGAHKKILLLSLHEDANQKISCNDCNTPLVCSTCQSDLILVTQKGIQHFLCRFCVKKTKSNQKCPTCQSWNLHALGINTQTIKKYIEKKYKGTLPDEVTISTLTELEALKKDPPIKAYDAIYILSLDGLMYAGDYASSEKIYRILKKIESFGKKMSIQTSFPSPNILNEFKTQMYDTWLSGEYAKRKKYLFPPYGTTYTIRAKNKKGLAIVTLISRAVEKKDIRYLSFGTGLKIYIEKKYERAIDLYLRKKTSPEITISKETSLF
jgi:primosomal protein N'